MESKEVFYPKNRTEWVEWLNKNHQEKSEIWVQTYNKASGKPTLTYDDLVEVCLCYGWIDGVVNKYDEDSKIQRITPRRKKSFLSELNRQRIWKLQGLGLMTPHGVAPIAAQIGSPDDPFDIPDWILEALKDNPEVWASFTGFPRMYQRLKIGWITEAGKSRQEEMKKRLAYLIKMTGAGKRYGTQPLL